MKRGVPGKHPPNRREYDSKRRYERHRRLATGLSCGVDPGPVVLCGGPVGMVFRISPRADGGDFPGVGYSAMAPGSEIFRGAKMERSCVVGWIYPDYRAHVVWRVFWRDSGGLASTGQRRDAHRTDNFPGDHTFFDGVGARLDELFPKIGARPKHVLVKDRKRRWKSVRSVILMDP